ncbi:MAG: tetratricopeptide repeat protein [Candidatus Eremiobacterota bacterium]
MTPKFGSGPQQKPQLPQKGLAGAAAGSGSGGGLVRKEVPSKNPMATEEGDKPIFGDIPKENLEEALAEVDAALAQSPDDKELHIRKYRILRKSGDRPAMRAALQLAARVCGDPFFGVKLAEALEEEGSYTKALEWRRWVAQFTPEDPDTIRRLAATAVRSGALKTAEVSYNKLIELRSGDEAPLGGTFYEEMLGKGLEPDKRLQLQQMGLRLLARALETRDASASLLEAAARLSYRVKDMNSSRGFYERALKTNADHKNARQWRVELLRVYSNLGVVDEWRALNDAIINELKEYVKLYRGDQRAWQILTTQLIQAGEFEEAIHYLKEALLADSKNAQALWELGRLYVRMGRSQEAVDYYDEIINDPNEKKSVRRAIERALADLFFKLGRYREALLIYDRDPEGNLRMIAPIYEAVGDIQEAEKLYQKSVKQAPRDARCHLGTAEFRVRQEDWEAAAEAGREGLRCSYATEEVHSNLAVALATAQMKLAQVEDALKTMEEICEAYPDSIHQIFRKVKLLVRLGRKEEALALAEEVRTQAQHQTGCAPASSALWSLLGDCCSLLGNIDEAEDSYTNALRYDFMDSAAVRGLGMVAEKRGDLRRALELYQRFVVLDPLNLAVPTIKGRIEELKEKVGPLPAPESVEEASMEQSEEVHATVGAVAEEQRAATPPPAPPPPPQAAPQAPPSPPPKTDGWLGTGEVDWYQQ